MPETSGTKDCSRAPRMIATYAVEHNQQLSFEQPLQCHRRPTSVRASRSLPMELGTASACALIVLSGRFVDTRPAGEK